MWRANSLKKTLVLAKIEGKRRRGATEGETVGWHHRLNGHKFEKTKKDNAKECSNCHTIAPISHASKVMPKILQAWLQQYVNCEFPDVQAGFRKGRRTRDQITNILWIIKKARGFQKKKSISALLTTPKPSTMWITINCGKFWKRWEYKTTLPDLPLEKPVCRSGSNS